MVLLRCCTLLILIVAVSIGGLLSFGSHYDFTAGMIPALVNVQKLTKDTIPDASGKIIVVTGANTGLGKSTAKHIAKANGKVIMACRSMKRCEDAKKQILSEEKSVKKSNLIPMELDLASLESVKRFSTKFSSTFDKLDSLILNAGVMHAPYQLTKDGIEMQIGVNHFGHFYLTKLLLPMLEKAQPSTIVSLSSNGHFMSYKEGIKPTLAAMNDETAYDTLAAYGQSKLANVLFTQELAERLLKDGKEIYINAVQPGAVNTDLNRHWPEAMQKVAKKIGEKIPNIIAFESDIGALTQVYAAISPEITEYKITGKYYVPLGQISGTHYHAKDIILQKKLWNLTEKVLKEKGFN